MCTITANTNTANENAIHVYDSQRNTKGGGEVERRGGGKEGEEGRRGGGEEGRGGGEEGRRGGGEEGRRGGVKRDDTIPTSLEEFGQPHSIAH